VSDTAPRWTDRPSYEEARDELVGIVARLESGQPTLEESLELWERGEYLATLAQEHLDGAQARLDAARATSDTADPADAPPEG
jgi:exodeoxyribonuclease VII small subunit